MLETREADGAAIVFEAEDVAIEGVDSAAPNLRYRHAGAEHLVECELVAGCDGFRGVSRRTIPADALREHEKAYPFGWLGPC